MPDGDNNRSYIQFDHNLNGTVSSIANLISNRGWNMTAPAIAETLEIRHSMANDTAATVSSDQYSPIMRYYSYGWKTAATAASQVMSIGYLNAPEQGVTNPVGVHKIIYGTNSVTQTEANELYRLEWGDRRGIVINEQGADQDFRIESDTVTNALAVDGATGDVTIGGALILPNGANPTVDAAGEIAIVTSAAPGSGIRFYGDAAYKIAGTYSKSFVITSPTASADAAIWRVPYNITIKAIHGVQVGGTNVVGTLTECDSNGLNPVVVDSADMTITTSNVNDDGSLSNATIDAGDYLGWATTSVSGTITRVTITFEYVVDAV